MSAILDNLMATGADASRSYAERFEFDVSAVQMQFGDARARFFRSITLDDMFYEMDDETLALLKGDDANALGRHLIAKRNAWLDRLAQREVYGS